MLPNNNQGKQKTLSPIMVYSSHLYSVNHVLLNFLPVACKYLSRLISNGPSIKNYNAAYLPWSRSLGLTWLWILTDDALGTQVDATSASVFNETDSSAKVVETISTMMEELNCYELLVPTVPTKFCLLAKNASFSSNHNDYENITKYMKKQIKPCVTHLCISWVLG